MVGVVVGVDGGGTKTVAIVYSPIEKKVLGRATAGASNVNSVGDDAADQAIANAITNALKEAQMEHKQVAAVACCLAGADDPKAAANRQDAVTKLLSHIDKQRVVVTTDAAAPVAALRDGELNGGLCLIAGTGCVAMAWSADGTKHRVAGWGPALGDGGSAHALATRALTFAVMQHDGRVSARTAASGGLHDCLLEALHMDSADALIPWIYDPARTWADVAALAPVVCKCAEAGDQDALGAVRTTAAELALYVRAAANRAGFESAFDVALCGGLVESQLVRHHLDECLAYECPNARTAEPSVEAATGAAMYAARLL